LLAEQRTSMTGILEGYVDRDDLAKELSGKGRPLHRQTTFGMRLMAYPQ
jgi:hypothetical protein